MGHADQGLAMDVEEEEGATTEVELQLLQIGGGEQDGVGLQRLHPMNLHDVAGKADRHGILPHRVAFQIDTKIQLARETDQDHLGV